MSVKLPTEIHSVNILSLQTTVWLMILYFLFCTQDCSIEYFVCSMSNFAFYILFKFTCILYFCMMLFTCL